MTVTQKAQLYRLAFLAALAALAAAAVAGAGELPPPELVTEP